MCGAPTAAAGTQSHSASYPLSARSPRTLPSPSSETKLRRAVTFSTKTNRGRSRRTIRAYSLHSPDLSPASPRRSPAMLRFWQGNPPQMMSVVGACSSISLTSSYCVASGQCLARTRRQNSSVSQFHTVRAPVAHSSPSSRPPMPLNSEPIVSHATSVHSTAPELHEALRGSTRADPRQQRLSPGPGSCSEGSEAPGSPRSRDLSDEPQTGHALHL